MGMTDDKGNDGRRVVHGAARMVRPHVLARPKTITSVLTGGGLAGEPVRRLRRASGRDPKATPAALTGHCLPAGPSPTQCQCQCAPYLYESEVEHRVFLVS